jgi:hypothetical protein
MSGHNAYQLPDEVEMPARFASCLSYQIWFYEGVLTGLEGLPALDVRELRGHHGQGVSQAYQAGLEAGRRRRQAIEAPPHNIQVPLQFSQSLYEKMWFMKGVDAGLDAQPLDYPVSLPDKRSQALLRAYKAGWSAGRRHIQED